MGAYSFKIEQFAFFCADLPLFTWICGWPLEPPTTQLGPVPSDTKNGFPLAPRPFPCRHKLTNPLRKQVRAPKTGPFSGDTNPNVLTVNNRGLRLIFRGTSQIQAVANENHRSQSQAPNRQDSLGAARDVFASLGWRLLLRLSCKGLKGVHDPQKSGVSSQHLQ